ncbi:hypothetical protein B0H19DRAFT_1203813 [Mycena capillaripes]|nr:hypothetical protein B0H19DRAFT_1203813 [Mycena capillaripes]
MVTTGMTTPLAIRKGCARRLAPCLVVTGILIVAKNILSHTGVARIGLDNVLVLIIGGIPIAMPTALSDTLRVSRFCAWTRQDTTSLRLIGRRF